MKIECYGGQGYEANCYLLIDETGEHALVLDPSVDMQTVFRQRGSSLPHIEAILLTHAHFDHMLGVDSFRRQTSAPLAIHMADAPALGDPDKNVYRLFTGHDGGTAPAERLLREGDRVALGEESLTVMHTPGHTPGSICLYAPGLLFSGDTLFAGGDIGRSDLPGGREEELLVSLQLLAKLPPHTRVYPGHGPQTTIEHEKICNPYLGE